MNKDTNKTKEQLAIEFEELRTKSKKQEDKLNAANQQLDAHNQQLQATEQQLKAANQQLTASEQKLRNIFENSTNMFYSHTVAHQLTYLSPQVEHILGYSVEEAMTKWTEFASDDPINEIGFKNTVKAIETGERQAVYELELVRKDGRKIIVEVRESPLVENGKTVAIVGSLVDITERKQAEYEIETIFNTAANGMRLIDYDFNIRKINNTFCEMVGLPENEIIGKKCYDVFWGEMCKTENCPLTKMQKNDDAIFEKEISKKRLDGKETPTILKAIPFKDILGNIVGIVEDFKDITERKQSEEEIKAANQQLKANNQQLQATEQQLQAANQQLTANNQQLIASEQEHKKEKIFSEKIVETADAIIMGLDKDHIIRIFNRGAEQITGYKKEEVIGKDWFKIFFPKEILDEMNKVWKNVWGVKSHSYINPILAKSGEERIISWQSTGIYDSDDITEHIHIAIGEDITERKQAEEDLEKNEQFLNDILNSVQDGISVLNPNLTIRHVNDKMKEWYKENLPLKGKKCYEVYQNLKKHCDPCPTLRCFESGKTEWNIVPGPKDSPVEWIELFSYPIKETNSDKVTGVIEFVRDITERKRNEQIQSIIHNISNAVITSHSPENFLTLVKDELGKLIDTTNFFVALYDEEADRISLPFQHDEKDSAETFPAGKTLTNYVIKTGKSLLATKTMIEKLTKSGEVEQVGHPSEVWLGVPLKSENKITGIFAVQSYDNENAFDKADVKMLEIISHQISLSLERLNAEEDIKLAKEKAEESDRLKSAFLANMSHEIRTPMNGILGFTGLLKEPQLTGDEKEKFIQVIERNGKRMLNTINDIIDISKIEAGQVKISNSEVSVNRLLDEQFNFYQREIKSKGLELNYRPSLTDSESRIITDPHKLEGILTNLLKNAIKYTETGEITFGCRLKDKADGKFIEFYVKDTGIGVPANRAEAIFNRFEQADIEDKGVYEGSGLGLAIAKSYVEMLGGEIGVSSKEGSGSTFTFSIPYNKQNLKDSAATQNKEEESGVSLKNLSVIVAEDDETSRMFFEIILKNHVKRITYTITGKETIEKFRENPDTDIILMDIKMPDMNGYDATREIRKFNKDVIIIAQTAHGLAGDKDKALEAGCDDYIAKPIQKELLFEKIRACLDKKSI